MDTTAHTHSTGEDVQGVKTSKPVHAGTSMPAEASAGPLHNKGDGLLNTLRTALPLPWSGDNGKPNHHSSP